MNKDKVVWVLRGVSGSGKSTVADQLCHLIGDWTKVRVCSADDFFMEGEEYKFDPKKLEAAHAYCREKFTEAIERETETIILANTNTQFWEFEKYKAQAEAAGYTVFCIIVENRHGGKNVHGVPEEKIQQMKDRFEVQL